MRGPHNSYRFELRALHTPFVSAAPPLRTVVPLDRDPAEFMRVSQIPAGIVSCSLVVEGIPTTYNKPDITITVTQTPVWERGQGRPYTDAAGQKDVTVTLSNEAFLQDRESLFYSVLNAWNLLVNGGQDDPRRQVYMSLWLQVMEQFARSLVEDVRERFDYFGRDMRASTRHFMETVKSLVQRETGGVVFGYVDAAVLVHPIGMPVNGILINSYPDSLRRQLSQLISETELVRLFGPDPNITTYIRTPTPEEFAPAIREMRHVFDQQERAALLGDWSPPAVSAADKKAERTFYEVFPDYRGQQEINIYSKLYAGLTYRVAVNTPDNLRVLLNNEYLGWLCLEVRVASNERGQQLPKFDRILTRLLLLRKDERLVWNESYFHLVSTSGLARPVLEFFNARRYEERFTVLQQTRREHTELERMHREALERMQADWSARELQNTQAARRQAESFQMTVAKLRQDAQRIFMDWTADWSRGRRTNEEGQVEAGSQANTDAGRQENA